VRVEREDWEAVGRLVPRLLESGRRLPFLRFEGGRGHRTSAEFGEFREHAPYVPGEDLRHFDWAVFARTREPVLRRFDGVLRRRFELLVDRSPSTGIRWPGYAWLASLLARLGRARFEEAFCRVAGTEGLRRIECRGDGFEAELFEALAEAPCPGTRGRRSAPRAADLLSAWEGLPAGRGYTLLSDFQPVEEWLEALARCAHRGKHVLCLYPRLPEESGRTPPPEGRLRLVDPESGEDLELRMEADLWRAFLVEQRSWEHRLGRELEALGHVFHAADLPSREEAGLPKAWLPFLHAGEAFG